MANSPFQKQVFSASCSKVIAYNPFFYCYETSQYNQGTPPPFKPTSHSSECWRENKTAPPGRAPPEKASEFVLRRRFAAGGRGNCEGYPGSIFLYLGGGSRSLCFTIQNRVFICEDAHLYLIVLIHVKRILYALCVCSSEHFVLGSDRYDGLCQIARIA